MPPKDPPPTSTSMTTTATLLSRAHCPDSTTRILQTKILHRPLFLRPQSPPPQVTARHQRRLQRLSRAKARSRNTKPCPLSARQKRKLGLHDIPRENQKYEIFEPLHNLWIGYMRELLGDDLWRGGIGAATKIASADLHGAEVEIVRSGCVSRVGVKGIVVKDCKFVFEVITRKNRMKIVPKEETVFRVVVPVDEVQVQAEGQQSDDGVTAARDSQSMRKAKDLVFEIHGDQFITRAADRARKLPKPHFLANI